MSNELTSEQRSIVESPLRGRTFLGGPAGAGKTTVGVHRLRYLLGSGIPEHSILVLAPQKRLAEPYLEEARSRHKRSGSEVTVATLGSISRQMVGLFWPLIAKEHLSPTNPYRRPTFLTLEMVQYIMSELLGPEIERKDYFNSVAIGRSRLYAQIADNLNKSAIVGFDHRTIGERLKSALGGDRERMHIYDDAQACANLFREYCIEHNFLDFSLQVKLFIDGIWKIGAARGYLTGRYRHLIVDNLEEDTPATHSLLAQWLETCESALLIGDTEAGYRRFLGADESSARSLAGSCDRVLSLTGSRVMSSGVESLLGEMRLILSDESLDEGPAEAAEAREAIAWTDPGSSRFHTQMLDWVAGTISDLVRRQGVPAGEIVVLAPLLGDSLRFALQSRLERMGVDVYTLRPSRPLHAEPAVEALMTFARLAHPAWGAEPGARRVRRFDVVRMLMCAIGGLDLARATLLAGVVFSEREGELRSFKTVSNPAMRSRISEVIGERYERIASWIAGYRGGEAGPIDVFFSRLFGELLSQPGYGFHDDFDAARIIANLIDSSRGFRRTVSEMDDTVDAGRAYVRMVDGGILAEQYEPKDWRGKPDAVLIAPAYTFLLGNRPVDYQFWLNIDSPGWSRRLFQPLTQPYVLSRQWPPGRIWTDIDETAASRDMLYRVITGLIRRCRRKIFIGHSKFDERGFEQAGELRSVLDYLLRRIGRQQPEAAAGNGDG